MTIFVGGSKHGTEDVGGPVGRPSAVDMSTGHQYVLAPVSMALTDLETGQQKEVWTNTVYMFTELAGNPQAAAANLGDAVTRWWFTTHGSLSKPSTAASNGHSDTPVGVLYSARCEECITADVFTDLLERAQYMHRHRETTGHTMSWSDSAPTSEGVTDGGQDQSNIH